MKSTPYTRSALNRSWEREQSGGEIPRRGAVQGERPRVPHFEPSSRAGMCPIRAWEIRTGGLALSVDVLLNKLKGMQRATGRFSFRETLVPE